jgi:hypothetical protein
VAATICASEVRASCRGCKLELAIEELTLAEVIGDDPPLHRAYHLECAATAAPAALDAALAAYPATIANCVELSRIAFGRKLWQAVADEAGDDAVRLVLAIISRIEEGCACLRRPRPRFLLPSSRKSSQHGLCAL